MEESQGQAFENENHPSYWLSVGISGVIFGIIVFILSLVYSYSIINSEPTGSFFSPAQLLGIVICLIGAFGGMLASWHYAKEYDVPIKLGRGALIGFITGAVIIVISALLGQIWQFIDPDMTQRMIDSSVANIEAMDLPDAQKQQTIDMTVENLRSQQNIGSQLLWGIPIYGVLNLLTGMIGAKIFGKKEEEF